MTIRCSLLNKAVWGDDRETQTAGNPNTHHFLSHDTAISHCPTVKVGTLNLKFLTIYKVSHFNGSCLHIKRNNCDTVLKHLHVNLFIHSVLVTSRPTLRHYSPGIILQKWLTILEEFTEIHRNAKNIMQWKFHLVARTRRCQGAQEQYFSIPLPLSTNLIIAVKSLSVSTTY